MIKNKLISFLRISDQAIVSAGNLALAILAARSLGPFQFGIFTLIWSIVVFSLGIQWALLISPMQLTIIKVEVNSKLKEIGSALIYQSFFISIFAGITAILIYGEHEKIKFFDILIIIAAIILILAQDYIRRWYLANDEFKKAFLADLFRHFGSCLIIYFLLNFHESRISIPCIFMIVGFFSAFSFIQFIKDMGKSIAPTQAIIQHFMDHQPMAKWLVPFVILQSFISLVPLYFLSDIIGASATGGYRVAILLTAPVIVISEAFETFLPIKAARVMTGANETKALKELLIKWVKISCFLSGIYLFLLNFLKQFLVDILFGEKYFPYLDLILPLSLAIFLQPITYIFNVYFRIRNITKITFLAEIGAALTMVAGYILIKIDGIGYGAALIAIYSQAIKLLIFITVYHKLKNKKIVL